MTCKVCQHLNLERPIKSPGDLAKAIRMARDHVEDGTLVEFQPDAAVTHAILVGDLAEDGPWPDYVESHFRCGSCSTHYKLAAETYHGAGGCWTRVTTA